MSNGFTRSSYTVWPGDHGWIVNRWGLDQHGDPQVRRVRIDWEASGVPKGTNLYGRYNNQFLNGDYIAAVANMNIAGVTVLRYGCAELAGVTP